MGVQFDRILESFTGPFERVTAWNVAPPPGRVTTADGATAFSLTREANDAFRALNRLLAAGEPVRAGEAFYFGTSSATLDRIHRIATELGVSFKAVTEVPDAATARRRSEAAGRGSEVPGRRGDCDRGADRAWPRRALWAGNPSARQPHGTFKLLFNVLY